MGMDVWVNVFTMSFLCADSGPWRRMSRAWPPMSAITKSGSTCPCHQEPAWGAAEARQEWDIMEKGHCCREMLEFVLRTSTNVFCQYCPRREGLGRGAAVRSICQASWPSPTTTLDRKRTTKRRRHFWWVEGFAVCLFVSFRSVLGCMGMNMWVQICLYDAILVRRLWTVENDVNGMISNVGDNDIIRLHVSVSPWVSLGSCWNQAGKGYSGCCY